MYSVSNWNGPAMLTQESTHRPEKSVLLHGQPRKGKATMATRARQTLKRGNPKRMHVQFVTSKRDIKTSKYKCMFGPFKTDRGHQIYSEPKVKYFCKQIRTAIIDKQMRKAKWSPLTRLVEQPHCITTDKSMKSKNRQTDSGKNLWTTMAC